MSASTKTIDPTIVDAASLFDACEALSDQHGSKVSLSYPKLRDVLDSQRQRFSWRPATTHEALLTIDPISEGQQRFTDMLKRSRFAVRSSHFKDAYVSLPPGQRPGSEWGKPITSMAARIAYIAGLIAGQVSTHLIVVSHAYELRDPLVDLLRRGRESKIAIAYFEQFLDHRWKSAGLLDGRLGLDFVNLDEHTDELFGIEHSERAAAPNGGNHFFTGY